MISKKIREEFEANYPMPFACGWNSRTSEYECIWPEHAGEPDTEVPILEHNDRLAVWIKSRAAIEVDLTEVRKTTALPDRTWLLGNDVVSTIESLGLKVRP